MLYFKEEVKVNQTLQVFVDVFHALLKMYIASVLIFAWLFSNHLLDRGFKKNSVWLHGYNCMKIGQHDDKTTKITTKKDIQISGQYIT